MLHGFRIVLFGTNGAAKFSFAARPKRPRIFLRYQDQTCPAPAGPVDDLDHDLNQGATLIPANPDNYDNIYPKKGLPCQPPASTIARWMGFPLYCEDIEFVTYAQKYFESGSSDFDYDTFGLDFGTLTTLACVKDIENLLDPFGEYKYIRDGDVVSGEVVLADQAHIVDVNIYKMPIGVTNQWYQTDTGKFGFLVEVLENPDPSDSALIMGTIHWINFTRQRIVLDRR